MSTIKSSAENLTLNADGANNDVIIQSNGSTKVTVDGATGAVGIGVTPESDWKSIVTGLQIGNSGSIFARNDSGETKTYIAENVKWTADAQEYINNGYASVHKMDAGTHTFQVAPSGSADAAITFTTGFEVLADGKARAKNGLLFGTDTAAANTLDDYEEGAWTPNIYNTGYSAGAATTSGIYTKVGRLVTCFFRVDDGVTGGGTGALKIAGLPFAPSGMPGSGTLGFCVVRAGSTGGSTGYRRGITYESGTEFNIMETTAADTAIYRYVSSGFSYLAAT